MKVAINRCYGGFGISNEAFEELLNRKGVAFEKVPSKFKFKGDDSDYYKAGQVGVDEAYLSPYQFYGDRSDADLIAVIEEMGEQSWGWAAELKIVDIPDDVEYDVTEYDGLEWVAEKHRTWS